MNNTYSAAAAVCLGMLLAAPVCMAEVVEIQPGVTARGGVPKIWELDLRKPSPELARSCGPNLSSRLYGPKHKLHHALLIQTESPSPAAFAFRLDAVSSGGSDLVVRTNGVDMGRQVWPAAGRTHQVGRIYCVPLPAGTNSITLEVTKPDGVVIIDRYYLADSISSLPQKPEPVVFKSGAMVSQEKPADPFANIPMTGGKLAADDGYRGIWYYNQPVNNEYKFKYSGGFATYPYQHVPIAIYCKEVKKTFFVYGGTTARSAADKQELLHMVSCYDHETGKVPRPRILLNKQTADAHDNPTLQVDDKGHLWIFSSSHGTGRPSFIHRSVKPWSIEEFERILVTNFSYTQPWYVPGQGFLFLHTRYGGGRSVGNSAVRCLFQVTSTDGVNWGKPEMLAGIEQGDYQVSWREGNRVATAFDFHPAQGGLNSRANVYYAETTDLGRTWHNVSGEQLDLPLSKTNNPALVYDSRVESKLAYLMDINFDGNGRPVVLFLTSKGFEPGPENGPREWQTLRWTGSTWERRVLTQSGNNYDHGSLYIEADGVWRVIGPTDPGPQPYNPGGEVCMWVSRDQGQKWTKVKQLTRGSKLNHTFVRRPVNAHPDFYALWADGNGRQASESSIYFTNQRGDHVWKLPAVMNEEYAKPTECPVPIP